MTYDIRVGEAVATCRAQIAPHDPIRGATVEIEHDAEAPTFPYDPLTGQTNRRDAANVVWYGLVKITGLEDLFFDHHGRDFTRDLPATRPLTAAHLARVCNARTRWEADHPGAVPGWNYNEITQLDAGLTDDGVSNRDPHLARLLWLEWWIDRALTRCHRPAVHIR